MVDLPTGTVTFLVTDIEGSTERWEQQRAAMAPALARHNAILSGAVDARGGTVFKTVGDAYCAVFPSAADALAAALDAQRALAAEDWAAFGTGFETLRVRMGLHTGHVELHDGDYYGPPLNRVARLMSAGHGGQILLSLATQQLVRDDLPAGCTLRDLGLHRLKDLRHSEHIFQVRAAGMPDIDTLPDTAEKLETQGHAPADVDLLPAECPFRGLAAFREADAPYFFGREAFTELLVEAVAAAPMVGVVGPSGSGKSSVVFAGLVPRLRENGGRGRLGGAADRGWTVVELRPGGRPYQALAGALVPFVLASGATEVDRLAETSKLGAFLRDGTIAPGDVLGRIAEMRPELGRLLLVADQFEELYTLCPDEGEQQAFQDLLFAAAFETRGGLPLTLALTLRADFMGHALAYRPFADAIQKHDVKLGPMTRAELARAVRLPAERQGRAFEQGLVERIVDDVGEKAGTLPLLEFALTKLWEEQAQGWLTHDAYEAIGRVEGAVARHADAAYVGLAEGERVLARKVFVQMVRPGEGTEDTRRLATRMELGDAGWALVRRLADARLVVTNRDEAGREVAEVVHEALIRTWGRLTGWMSEDRRFRMWQERLRFGLKQWEEAGRDEGALLRGVPLGEAEWWLAERGGEMTDGEREFVAAGVGVREREASEREAKRERELAMERRRAEERAAAARTLRRRAIWLAGAAMAAILAAAGAVVMWQRAGHQTRLATVRELLAASLSAEDADSELSVLLAIAAHSRAPLSNVGIQREVQTVLHRSLYRLRALKPITTNTEAGHASLSGDGQYAFLEYPDSSLRMISTDDGHTILNVPPGAGHRYSVSQDGRWLATAAKDTNSVRMWDVAAASETLTITAAITNVTGIWLSPTGDRIAVNDRDRTMRILDSATGRQTAELVGSFDYSGLMFSPDGRRVVTCCADTVAEIWDSQTGTKIGELKGHAYPIGRLTFSPDGSRIVTTSGDDTARVWNAESFEQILVISQPGLSAVRISPDGTLMASAGGGLHVFSLANGAAVLHIPGPTDDLAFDPDGRCLLATTSTGTARVLHWDLGPLREVLTVSSAPFDMESVAYSPDGSRLATASDDKLVRVVDSASGEVVQTLSGHTAQVNYVAFSPDGRAVASVSSDETARLWDAQTGRAMRVMRGHGDAIWTCAFSADGARLATIAWDYTVRLWDVASGRETHHFDAAGGSFAVALSPDGKHVAAGGADGTVHVIPVVSASQATVLSGLANSSMIIGLAYRPDGSIIAAGSDDGTVSLWYATTGRLLRQWAAHQSSVARIAYSPDGRQLATSGDDNTARIWDVASGELLVSLEGHTASIVDVAFSPDGRRLATASYDGTASVWLLDPTDLIALARSRLTRTLTPEECRQYLHVEACPADAAGPPATSSPTEEAH